MRAGMSNGAYAWQEADEEMAPIRTSDDPAFEFNSVEAALGGAEDHAMRHRWADGEYPIRVWRNIDGVLQVVEECVVVCAPNGAAAGLGEDAREPIMRFFAFEHLREGPMREMSRLFATLAEKVHGRIPRSAERSVALRKLLEGKDAAVRALLPEKP